MCLSVKNQKHWHMKYDRLSCTPPPVMSVIQFQTEKKNKKLSETERAEDQRAERPSHLVEEMVKWQVSLFSTPHIFHSMNNSQCALITSHVA